MSQSRSQALLFAFLPALPVLLVALGIGGCEAVQGNQRLDPNTQDRVVSTDRMNVDDAVRAGEQLVESMFDSPAFDAVSAIDGGTPVIEVSTFVDRSNQGIDRDFVMKRVRAAITRSGLARVRTTMQEDRATAVAQADRLRQEKDRAFLEGLETKEVQRNVRLPDADYSLTMKIIERRERENFTREVSYLFQMTLADTASANVVWEDEAIITKQGGVLNF